MRLAATRNALVRLFHVPDDDHLGRLGAGVLANALLNLEILARANGKKD